MLLQDNAGDERCATDTQLCFAYIACEGLQHADT